MLEFFRVTIKLFCSAVTRVGSSCYLQNHSEAIRRTWKSVKKPHSATNTLGIQSKSCFLSNVIIHFFKIFPFCFPTEKHPNNQTKTIKDSIYVYNVWLTHCTRLFLTLRITCCSNSDLFGKWDMHRMTPLVVEQYFPNQWETSPFGYYQFLSLKMVTTLQ